MLGSLNAVGLAPATVLPSCPYRSCCSGDRFGVFPDLSRLRRSLCAPAALSGPADRGGHSDKSFCPSSFWPGSSPNARYPPPCAPSPRSGPDPPGCGTLAARLGPILVSRPSLSPGGKDQARDSVTLDARSRHTRRSVPAGIARSTTVPLAPHVPLAPRGPARARWWNRGDDSTHQTRARPCRLRAPLTPDRVGQSGELAPLLGLHRIDPFLAVVEWRRDRLLAVSSIVLGLSTCANLENKVLIQAPITTMAPIVLFIVRNLYVLGGLQFLAVAAWQASHPPPKSGRRCIGSPGRSRASRAGFVGDRGDTELDSLNPTAAPALLCLVGSGRQHLSSRVRHG